MTVTTPAPRQPAGSPSGGSIDEAFDLLNRIPAQARVYERGQSVHLAAREERLADILTQDQVLPKIQAVEEITRDDLLALRTTETDVLGLRYSHHEMARLTALGMSLAQISRATGTAETTISTLRRSPAFMALVAQYRDQELAGLNSLVRDRLTMILMDTLTELHTKVVEGGQANKLDDLRKVTETLLDRTGHSPVQKTMSVAVGLNAKVLQHVKDTVRASLAVEPATPAALDE